MKLKYSNVFLLFLGAIIGGLIILQMKSVVPFISSHPLDNLGVQQELIDLFVDEQQILEDELVVLQKEVNEIEEKRQRFTSREQQSTRHSLRMGLGLEPVTGEGIRIFFADGLKSSRDGDVSDESELIHTADLRDVVNVLFAAGAEAVSINNRRILPLASINFVGNSFLLNGFHVFPPFVIQAIGPSQVLKSYISDEDALPSLYERVRANKLRFVLVERDDFTVPAYQAPLPVTYLQPFNEE
jgi:uncharacterized protein YlxW (UPF0749 family)